MIRLQHTFIINIIRKPQITRTPVIMRYIFMAQPLNKMNILFISNLSICRVISYSAKNISEFYSNFNQKNILFCLRCPYIYLINTTLIIYGI